MSSDDEKKRGKDDGLSKKSKHGKEHRAGAKRRRREEQSSGGSVISRDPTLDGKAKNAISGQGIVRTWSNVYGISVSPIIHNFAPPGADEKRKSVPSGTTAPERTNADVMAMAASQAGLAAIHPATNSVQQLPPRQEPGTESFRGGMTSLQRESASTALVGALAAAARDISAPLASVASSTDHHQQIRNSNPLFRNPPGAGVPASNTVLEPPLALLARLLAEQQGGPHLSSSEVLAQHLPVDQPLSQQTTNEPIPLLNPNHFVQQPSTIQEMLRQMAQAALQSGQPPPLSQFLPPNNAPTAVLHPLLGGPRYMGPQQQHQPAPFYHQDSVRPLQQQQQNPALSNTQLLSVLSSLLQLQDQQQQQVPPFPQAAAANVLTSLIQSSFGQPQQQQQAQPEQQQSRGGGGGGSTLNSILYAPPNAAAAAASMLQQGLPPPMPALHPNLVALLQNFASSTAAASNNNNPEPIPPRTAAVANPARSYQTSNNDGNVSSNSGGSDLVMELSGRPPVVMYIPEVDDRSLSEYQCMVRKQIEIFEATHEDVECQVRSFLSLPTMISSLTRWFAFFVSLHIRSLSSC
jgi:hypothetical protein